MRLFSCCNSISPDHGVLVRGEVLGGEPDEDAGSEPYDDAGVDPPSLLVPVEADACEGALTVSHGEEDVDPGGCEAEDDDAGYDSSLVEGEH